MASISLEPMKLVVFGAETREEAVKRTSEDRERYLKEARRLVEFLEFYGKQLGYAIFKEIRWLVDRFPMKTEVLILSYILEAANHTKSYFSASTGPWAFVNGLKSDKSRLEKLKKQIEKTPSFMKMTLFEKFGRTNEKRMIDIDVYEETVERLKRVEKDLELSLELENEAWKLWFAERLFERIAYLPSKGKESNEALHRFASDLLKRKKKREITALEKIVNLFS